MKILENKFCYSSDLLLSSFAVGASATLLFADLWLVSSLICLVALSALAIWRYRFLLFLCTALAGFVWASYFFSQHQQQLLPFEFERVNLTVAGRIVSLPVSKETSQRFVFKVRESSVRQLSGQLIQLACYHCPLSFSVGQQWQLTVRLKRPNGYASWAAFDYEKFLFRKRIVAKGYIRVKDKQLLIKEASGSYQQWRQRVAGHLQQTLADSQVGRAMLLALLIGDKSEFTQQQLKVFQLTGISHLLAISGLHIGLVFMLTLSVSRYLLMPFARVYEWVPRQWLILCFSLIMAFLYAALAGFAISTQRAIIMLSVYVLTQLFARQASLIKTLLLAAVLVLLYDPFSVLDMGFWLSFTAVLIIGIANHYQQNLNLLSLQPLLWLGMMPLSLLFFAQLSLLSPLINLVLVPLFCLLLIPLSLLSLLLILLDFSSLSDWLLVNLSKAYTLLYAVLEYLSELKFSALYLSSLSFLQWGLFFAVLLTLLIRWRYRYAVLGLFLFSLFSLWNFRQMENNLLFAEAEVVLFDVGQGLAMLVKTQNSVLVYDTGPAYPSGFSAAQAVLIPYLRQQRIQQIDTLIISHADNDHIGGYTVLSESFAIKRILSSRTDKISSAQDCMAGQQWSRDGVDFKILSPDANTPQGSNNRSCVLRVSNGVNSILITGDIERPVERYLLAQNQALQADILLVPHQGSKTSSSNAFIQAVNPQIALIAAGYANHYGHPHAEVVKRYQQQKIKLLSTIESGSIRLFLKQNQLSYQAYRLSDGGFWNNKKPNIRQ